MPLSISLLDIYTQEKTYVHVKTWIRMFIATLFIRAKK